MTLRIEKVTDGQPNRIRLIGRVRAEHIDALKQELGKPEEQIVLDLEEVTLVDLEVVRFFNRCRACGVVLVNSSPYIQEWMRQEEREEI